MPRWWRGTVVERQSLAGKLSLSCAQPYVGKPSTTGQPTRPTQPFVLSRSINWVKKGKVLPYSLPSVGPAADLDVQAVSPQVTWSHPPGGRLPLLSARPAVTFPAVERHRPSASTKLYCMVTEAHACEQLAQDCYLEAGRPRFEPATFRITSERSTVQSHRPPRKKRVTWAYRRHWSPPFV